MKNRFNRTLVHAATLEPVKYNEVLSFATVREGGPETALFRGVSGYNKIAVIEGDEGFAGSGEYYPTVFNCFMLDDAVLEKHNERKKYALDQRYELKNEDGHRVGPYKTSYTYGSLAQAVDAAEEYFAETGNPVGVFPLHPVYVAYAISEGNPFAFVVE